MTNEKQVVLLAQLADAEASGGAAAVAEIRARIDRNRAVHPQDNLLARRDAKARDRRFSNEPLTGFGDA
jgi:hypothetical protein